jgi:hypothetical protein
LKNGHEHTHPLGQIRRGKPALLLGQVLAVLELLLNLVARANERDAIHCGHDRLLHDLARHLPLEHDRKAVTILRVLLQYLLHHVPHKRVPADGRSPAARFTCCAPW